MCSAVEHNLIGRCRTGCTSPLCAFNDDPAGELDYLKRTRHYGPVYTLEILLRHMGWLVDGGVLLHGDHVRRDDFHTAIDRIIVESKQAKRNGDREDLGRYDERFAGLYLSWAPTLLATEDGSRPLHGMPHVIHIEWRRSAIVTDSSGNGPGGLGLSLQFGEPTRVSGQQASFVGGLPSAPLLALRFTPPERNAAGSPPPTQRVQDGGQVLLSP